MITTAYAKAPGESAVAFAKAEAHEDHEGPFGFRFFVSIVVFVSVVMTS